MHAWLGAAPVCSAECLEKVGTPPREEAAVLRARGLRALSRARRLSAQGSALTQLVDDRHQAAAMIIGLTKSGRQEKNELLAQANQFQGALESVEYEFEQSLMLLVGALMGLREDIAEATECAIELAREYPGNRVTLAHQERTQRLADLLGDAPTPLVRETVSLSSYRVERHHDAIAAYERVSLRQGASAWNLIGSADWAAVQSAELVDTEIQIRHEADDALLRIPSGKEARTVWSWLAAERPDLGVSQRSMTIGEALFAPGCVLLAVLGVGGALASGASYLALPALLVMVLWGITSLLALVALGWGARDVVMRKSVPQLGVVERQVRNERVRPSRG